MNSGMSEQMATLRYEELVGRNLHEEFVASVVPPLADTFAVRTVLKQQLGALLVRVRVRLKEVHAGPGPWLAPGAASEWEANASSHEPTFWLSPCRLP